MLYFIPNNVEINLDGSKKKILEPSKDKNNDLIKAKKTKNKEKETKKPEKKIHKKSKKRCNFIGCKKKLKLSDLECNCGFRFCSKHRLPELHLCIQNFKEKNREKYLKKVQLGGGEVIKIDKI